MTSRYAEKLRIDPSGRFLYALSLDDLLSVYEINLSFGNLTLVGGNIPAPLNSPRRCNRPDGQVSLRRRIEPDRDLQDRRVHRDAHGRAGYRGKQRQRASRPPHQPVTVCRLLVVEGNVRSFVINAGSGALTGVANQSGLSGPSTLAMDPVGRVIYVAGSKFATLSFRSCYRCNGACAGRNHAWSGAGRHPPERTVYSCARRSRATPLISRLGEGPDSVRRPRDRFARGETFDVDPANRFAFAVDDRYHRQRGVPCRPTASIRPPTR